MKTTRMKRTRVALIAYALMAADVYISSAVAEDDIPHEAVIAWRQLRDHYSSVKYQYRRQIVDSDGGKSDIVISVKHHGEWFAKQKNILEEDSDVRVLGQNSQYMFGISSKDGRTYHLNDVLPRDSRISTTELELDGLETVTFRLLFLSGMPVEALLDKDVFLIKHVEELNGNHHVRIDFRRIVDVAVAPVSTTDLVIKGWVVLNPNAAWCVAEYELELQGGIVTSGTNEYLVTDGVPVKSAFRSTSRWPNDRFVSTTSVDYGVYCDSRGGIHAERIRTSRSHS